MTGVQNRLDALFQRKKSGILNIYVTAGYPALDDTLPIMEALQTAGADIIELGIPFSDPLADGPVIQASAAKAIANGMKLPLLLQQLTVMRTRIDLPVVLMGYYNPVMRYGFEKFLEQASAVGVDGIILPDLPIHRFAETLAPLFEKYNLHPIFLVTPDTPDERVRKLDAISSGFLYAVSSASITGANSTLQNVDAYLHRLKTLRLRNPVLVGFGIASKKDFDSVCNAAAGGIIGSAFIKALSLGGDVSETTMNFVKTFRA